MHCGLPYSETNRLCCFGEGSEHEGDGLQFGLLNVKGIHFTSTVFQWFASCGKITEGRGFIILFIERE